MEKHASTAELIIRSTHGVPVTLLGGTFRAIKSQ